MLSFQLMPSVRAFMASKMPKVYLARRLDSTYELLKDRYDVSAWIGQYDQPIPRDVLLKNVEEADALVVSAGIKVNEEVLEHGKNLKVIATTSVGYDHIDVDACRRRGIKLGHAGDLMTEPTAEAAMTLILCTTRRVFESNRLVHEGKWKGFLPPNMCGRGILDSVVGIVGMGKIGASIAEKLLPFHPKELLYHNRKPSEKGNALGAKYMPSLDDLLRRSDFVICACSLTPETKRMFNKDRFDQMKPTAQFFNVSRGGLVDHDALYDALANKTILAAGLDVSTPEPLPADHKLLTLLNFVMFPHIGGVTAQARQRLGTLTAENIIAGLEGRPLPAEIPA